MENTKNCLEIAKDAGSEPQFIEGIVTTSKINIFDKGILSFEIDSLPGKSLSISLAVRLDVGERVMVFMKDKDSWILGFQVLDEKGNVKFQVQKHPCG